MARKRQLPSPTCLRSSQPLARSSAYRSPVPGLSTIINQHGTIASRTALHSGLEPLPFLLASYQYHMPHASCDLHRVLGWDAAKLLQHPHTANNNSPRVQAPARGMRRLFHHTASRTVSSIEPASSPLTSTWCMGCTKYGRQDSRQDNRQDGQLDRHGGDGRLGGPDVSNGRVSITSRRHLIPPPTGPGISQKDEHQSSECCDAAQGETVNAVAGQGTASRLEPTEGTTRPPPTQDRWSKRARGSLTSACSLLAVLPHKRA